MNLIEILNINESTPNPLQEMNVTNWLKKNKHRLSIRGIESELGCPSTTLAKVISGKRQLPKKWEKPLGELIRDMERK